jgi:hypothetical protein
MAPHNAMRNRTPMTKTTAPDRTFAAFMAQVCELLEGTASGKGYNASGADGVNELYAFVQTMNGNEGHALGEIVYKARRFAAKGNIEDIVKAAAWAYLVYKHHKS